MNRVYRKSKVSRTGFTVLPDSEKPYMGANYRVAVGGSGGTGSSGVGPPSGTANNGSIYIDTSTGAVYYFYSGAWH